MDGFLYRGAKLCVVKSQRKERHAETLTQDYIITRRFPFARTYTHTSTHAYINKQTTAHTIKHTPTHTHTHTQTHTHMHPSTSHTHTHPRLTHTHPPIHVKLRAPSTTVVMVHVAVSFSPHLRDQHLTAPPSACCVRGAPLTPVARLRLWIITGAI